MAELILIRGGGDLASGVAMRLHRARMKTVIAELPQPLAVRRAVSFAEAVYSAQITVEEITARLVSAENIQESLEQNEIPVVIDPQANLLLRAELRWAVVVDARMMKSPPEPLPRPVSLHIGLGPGFRAGRDCHAVVETNRSHTLGRVYWSGETQRDSGLPEGDPRRVLRAPRQGIFIGYAKIGQHVETNEIIAEVNGEPILAPFAGVVRGLLRSGLVVSPGMKVGDVDPRDRPEYCFLVSDKSLAIGGGVLEAILSQPEMRHRLWDDCKV